MATHYERTWDEYSCWWDSDAGLAAKYKYLGDEWGDDQWVSSVLENYAFPNLKPNSTVLEIGPGGGRYTAPIASHCSLLVCVDVSHRMLDRVRRRLGNRKDSCFLKGNGHDLAGIPDRFVDFVWSSNVFVQLEFEDIVSYLSEIKRVLKPGGRASIHYATISSQDGWQYFRNNCARWRDDPRGRGRFCELTLETVHLLANRLGLAVVTNGCLGRDAMIVVENMAVTESSGGENIVSGVAGSSDGRKSILELLHAKSPYAGFPLHEYCLDLQGWHSDHPMLTQLVREIRPELVIEVGSWKGGSAIHMAGLMKAEAIPGTVVCVDTWLGALEFWDDHQDQSRYKALAHRFGYPGVYFQFLANVLHNKLQDVIVPFPQTSLIAARWFEKRKIQADLIYIDASHDEPDVAADLRAYWPLVKEGGILFGDDYDEYWPGLVRAVQAFAAEHSLPIQEQQGFWQLRKPAKQEISSEEKHDVLEAVLS